MQNKKRKTYHIWNSKEKKYFKKLIGESFGYLRTREAMEELGKAFPEKMYTYSAVATMLSKMKDKSKISDVVSKTTTKIKKVKEDYDVNMNVKDNYAEIKIRIPTRRLMKMIKGLF